MSFDPNLNPLQDINAEFEEREAQELAIKLGLEYINIAKFPLNPDVLVKIGDEQKSRDFMVIPFFKNLPYWSFPRYVYKETSISKADKPAETFAAPPPML